MNFFSNISIPFPNRPSKKKRLDNSMLESQNKDDKTLYKYSCAMLNLSDEIANIIKYWAKKMIPKDCLFIDEDEGMDGYEDTPHVTVKYGIHDTKPTELKKLTKGFGSVGLKFEKVTKFKENPKIDVLKIDVIGDDLKKLNKLITDNMKCTDKFDEYKPHVTLAYLKKGKCKELVDNDFFTELEDIAKEIYFNSRDGEGYFIKL